MLFNLWGSGNVRKVGIDGGTFDPIHNGHIESACQVFNKLKLDEILFIPTGNPPHKVSSNITKEEQRFKMVQLAIKEYKGFNVSDIETKRKGYSFTVDTLKILHKEYTEKYGEVKFYYIIGTDVLSELSLWKDYDKVISMFDFAVLKRPGYDYENAKEKAVSLGAIIHEIEAKEIDISSTEIRRLVREGKSIKGMVHPSVEEFIMKNRLYINPIKYDIESIKKDLKERLSSERYTHSLGVMDECIRLGQIYSADLDKCAIAGLLHDCAKELSMQQYGYLGIDVSPTKQKYIEGYNKNLLHAKAGAVVAKQRYGIIDEEILDAVESHVTGHPYMGILSQIVFLADYTESNRKGTVFDDIRKQLDKGLSSAMLYALDSTIKYVVDKGFILGPDTILTRNYFLLKNTEDI